jgi:hypothetical protein
VEGTAAELPASESLAEGSTISQAKAPNIANMVAVKNDASHPKWEAINGVSEAVAAPPSCPPIFIVPETMPEYSPAKSAVTDQKQLWDKYKAPAPHAKTMLAVCALCVLDPARRSTAVNARANAGRKHRPTRAL